MPFGLAPKDSSCPTGGFADQTVASGVMVTTATVFAVPVSRRRRGRVLPHPRRRRPGRLP